MKQGESNLNLRLWRSMPRPAVEHRGVAIVLVIVAVAAAAVIGSAYVASQLNAPQIVGNVNAGIEARYIADSGADLATAIMECETFDWRAAQDNGVLVDNLNIGNGKVSIKVKDVSGSNPDSTCEYPVVVCTGKSGDMTQLVGMQVHAPRPEVVAKTVDVDLSEFAAFGNTSIDLANGWIMGWPESPLGTLGLPVNIGTNGTARSSVTVAMTGNAPQGLGFVMAVADPEAIANNFRTSSLVRRVEFSTNEPILLPAPPTPDLSGLLWATVRAPNITADTAMNLGSNKRHTSLTVDNAATLSVDLGGGTRAVGISGPLTIQNGGVLRIDNGHLNLVVQGAFNMFGRSALELGPNASLTIYLGGTMSIDDSVVGLPVRWRDFARDARKGMSEYFDPSLCTIYRITSINSVDLNLFDGDDAAAWAWTDGAVKSWLLNTGTYLCGRMYGHSKVSLSLNNRSAVFGNVVANSIIVATESAIYYDHKLNPGNGYTNPDSALYAAPMDLRDDIRLLLTDLNHSTLALVTALLASAPPPPVAIDPMAPTPRDKSRVAHRWWKRYGVQLKRDRSSAVEEVIAAGP